MCVVERWLQIAHAQVNESRAAGRHRKHLPMGTADVPQAVDAQCPSGDPFPICCPCVQRNPSANLVPKFGPVLLLVPALLIPNWMEEWEKAVDESSEPLGMCLRVGHTGSSTAKKLSHKDKKYLTTKDETSVAHRLEQSRWVVLTSSGSYEGQVHKILRSEVVHPPPVKGSRLRRPTAYADFVQWGRVFRDEFHLEKSIGTKSISIIKGLQGVPYKWMMSGTPFEVSPNDLEGYIGVLETPEWKADERLRECTVERLQDMGKRFGALVRGKAFETFEPLAEEFGRLLRTLMIRRVTETDWWGGPIVELPPHEHRDIDCGLDPRYAEAVRTEQERVRRNYEAKFAEVHNHWVTAGRPGGVDLEPKPSHYRFFTANWKSRLFASIPALAHLAEREELELTAPELKGMRVYDENEDENDQSVYEQYLDQIVRSSAKIRQIGVILDLLGTDYKDRKEKILIMTEFPVAALIIYLVSAVSPEKLFQGCLCMIELTAGSI